MYQTTLDFFVTQVFFSHYILPVHLGSPPSSTLSPEYLGKPTGKQEREAFCFSAPRKCLLQQNCTHSYTQRKRLKGKILRPMEIAVRLCYIFSNTSRYNYLISRIMPYFFCFDFDRRVLIQWQFDNWWLSWNIYVPNMFFCKVWFLDNALFLEQSVFAIALLSIYFPGETGNRSSQGFPAKKIFIEILSNIKSFLSPTKDCGLFIFPPRERLSCFDVKLKFASVELLQIYLAEIWLTHFLLVFRQGVTRFLLEENLTHMAAFSRRL